MYTEATNVNNFVESSRLFGTLASTELVNKRVKEVIPGLQKDGRRKSGLCVAWVIQTRTVEKKLPVRSVQAGSTPTPTSSPPPSGLEVGSPVIQASPAADARHAPGQPSLSSLSYAVRADGAVSLEPPTTPATVTAHGVMWASGGVAEPVGGPVARRTWSCGRCRGRSSLRRGARWVRRATRTNTFWRCFP